VCVAVLVAVRVAVCVTVRVTVWVVVRVVVCVAVCVAACDEMQQVISAYFFVNIGTVCFSVRATKCTLQL